LRSRLQRLGCAGEEKRWRCAGATKLLPSIRPGKAKKKTTEENEKQQPRLKKETVGGFPLVVKKQDHRYRTSADKRKTTCLKTTGSKLPKKKSNGKDKMPF